MPKRKGLTSAGVSKLEEVHNAIKGYIEEHGYAPSVKEIGEVTGLRSTSSVHVYMERLFQLGILETDMDKDMSPTNGAKRAYRLRTNNKQARMTRENEQENEKTKIVAYENLIMEVKDLLFELPPEMSSNKTIKKLRRLVTRGV